MLTEIHWSWDATVLSVTLDRKANSKDPDHLSDVVASQWVVLEPLGLH